MANRFWIGDAVGGDVWSNANAWAAASGGAGGAGVPVTGDDVFFDAASVRDCQLDMNAVVGTGNDIATMDCNGYTGTFDMNGNTIEITGLLFRLDAGMAGFTVAFGGDLDFTAVAGVVAITTAGWSLNNVRVGNLGAGATYQQQDALRALSNLVLVNGVWDTNGNNLRAYIMNIAVTMLANGLLATTATVTIDYQLNHDSDATVISIGTSSFTFSGTGVGAGLAVGGGGGTGSAVVAFYDLSIGNGANGFAYTGSIAGGGIIVSRTFTTGAAACTFAGAGYGIRVQSTLVNGFQPNAACALGIPIIIDPQTGVGTTVTIPACALGSDLTLTRNTGGIGTCLFQLTGIVTVAGNLSCAGTGVVNCPTLDLNGFNLTVTGNANFYAPGSGMGLVTIGAAQLQVNGNLTHRGNPNIDSRLFLMVGGDLLVGGNFTHNGAVATAGQRIDMTSASSIVVGGNWSTTPQVFNPLLPTDTSFVQFTAAGAFTIACAVNEVWPVVRITGGGHRALPNPFVCQDLIITAGVVTAGAVLRVLRAFNNGGTFTGGANMYIGGSFTNTGVIVMAGVNLHLTGPSITLSGFNPVTLTMEATCVRLQFLTACTVTTFVIADRIVPGVVYFLAAAGFTVTTLNSQVVSTDGTIQFVSSVAGTRYTLTVTNLTSKANIWPRDCIYVGPVFVADLTNRDLGNNLGMALNFPPAFVRVITDDAGADLLAAGGIGPMNYCWLVGTSLVDIMARAAAFAGGSYNWHRRTVLPFAFLDNLVKGGNYWLALGLMDDRNNRVAPNIGAGDFVTATAISDESGAGGARKIHVNVKIPTMS